MQSNHLSDPLSKCFDQQFIKSKLTLHAEYETILKEIKNLTHRYPKAFDSEHLLSFFDNKERFNKIKKPLAKNLVEKALELETHLDDSHQFIASIAMLDHRLKLATTINETNDPKGWLDYWRKKPLGGELGEHLRTLKSTINGLLAKKNELVKSYIAECTKRLDCLYTALAIVRERLILLEQTDHGVKLTKAIVFPNYFKQTLKSQLAGLDDPSLVAFIKTNVEQFKLSLTGKDPNEIKAKGKKYSAQLKNLEKRLLTIIDDTKLIFFEVYTLDWLLNFTDEGKKKAEKDIIFKKFLLFDFSCQLPFIEKEFWWRLFVQYRLLSGNSHSLKKDTKSDIFLLMLVNSYSSYETKYQAALKTLPLLESESIINFFRDSNTLELANLAATFRELAQSFSVPINALVEKDENEWRMLESLPNCKWSIQLGTRFNAEVTEPLNMLMAMTMLNQEEDAQSKNYLSQLFMRASAITNVLNEEQDVLTPAKTA